MADAYADDPPDDKPVSKGDLKKIHKTAMERFKQGNEAYSDQAERELKDLKFASRIDQWTSEELAVRAGFTQGQTTIGVRPSLVVDKLRQPIQQLENQQRQANLAVDVHPSGGAATAKTAEAIQGLYRHIQVTSRADQIARFWAYSHAVKVGRGVYKVEKVYAPYDPKIDPEEAAFDQELKISRILNQASVILDPYAQEPDWSDGEWAFEKAWVPQDRYKRRRPDAKLAKADEDTFSTIGDQQPNWVRKDGDTWSVLVVKYWYIEIEKGEKLEGPNGQTRTLETRTVYCCEMDAHEITERTEWDGRYIPLIPVIANEENIDGKRRWEGIVAPAKDAQRTFNALTSAFIETVALAPKAPFTATIEQIGPFKAWWDQANVRNFPYLPYKAQTEGGRLIDKPQRMFGEPPIQAIAMGIHQFDANINAVTGFFDPSRGNLSSGERSGVALQALQKQSETGNSGYLDNLAQISMTYEAKVILDLIPKVYDREGRIARILGIDDAPQAVMLNAPFVKGPDGQPQAPTPMTPPADIEHYDLAEGVFTSTITIGKAHTTARQEAAEQFGQIIQSEPQLLMILGDLYFANLDGPGMQDAAKRMKKMLPPQLKEEQPGQQPDAAQLQQQLGQLQQHLQQIQPLADANQAKLQQSQMEQQANMQLAQIEAQNKLQIAQAQEETKRLTEQMKAEALVQAARMKAFADSQNAAGKAQADVTQTVMQEQGANERAHLDRVHEATGHLLDLRQQAVQAHNQPGNGSGTE